MYDEPQLRYFKIKEHLSFTPTAKYYLLSTSPSGSKFYDRKQYFITFFMWVTNNYVV